MNENAKLPLFIITGASGSGKSTVVPHLRELLPDFDVFDIDEELITNAVGDWQIVKNIWMRIASHIAKSKRMTILCGTQMPWEIEKCDDYKEFSQFYFLNLHCDDSVREKRLLERGWSNELIVEHKIFAKWLIENADKEFDPPMVMIDTSHTSVNEVSLKVKDWVEKYVR
jgi:dephospho-CoA kinase